MEHKTDVLENEVAYLLSYYIAVETGTPVYLNNTCIPMLPSCTLHRKHDQECLWQENDISFNNLKHVYLRMGFLRTKTF